MSNPQTSSEPIIKESVIKVFGKWDTANIEHKDAGLKGYISVAPVLVPHSCGRHEHKRFGKAKVNIVERLANRVMRPGKNGGKKALALSIVENALEIVAIKSGDNPVQVLVKAIENSAPKE